MPGKEEVSTVIDRRGSGVLLHLSSLPSPFGIGDMGPWAYRFADFLAETKQSYWQILPLNPIEPLLGNSPYHSISAFASNTLLLSPEMLFKEGWIDGPEPSVPHGMAADRVDYERVISYKGRLFERAYQGFMSRGSDPEFDRFCEENAGWLDDFALFKALKSRFGGRIWNRWPKPLRDRDTEALGSAARELDHQITMEKFLQYLFARQWEALKLYCNRKGVRLIGDIPIYVDYDSADVWTHPELFKLDDQKRPTVISGVPPDYFSSTGQLWGNPIYRWDVLRDRDFDWWIQRIAHNLKFFDMIRLDHFRGFVAYWEVRATEKTALSGRWAEAPAFDFFSTLKRRFVPLPIIAEDLGVITPDVREVMEEFNFPGMKILLFAFGQDMPSNPYIPHNFDKHCVAYTGTHDNNTIRGWMENEADDQERRRVYRYLGRSVPLERIHWELIRLVMMSVAEAAVFPMQDLLGLGEEARMNRPATREGNWRWRLLPGQLSEGLIEVLLEMTETYGRA